MDLTAEQKTNAKRTFKKMIFVYMALLGGWQIHMLHDGKFQLTRGCTTPQTPSPFF